MKNTFIQARATRCIGCRTCEIACALSHGDACLEEMTVDDFRARIAILKTGEVSMPLTCRHCEDAPCAAACPQGALHIAEGKVLVQQDKCIGCKNCVVGCPYGVVRVTTRRVRRTVAGSFLGFMHKAQAHKCDLCSASPEGPACVRACPTEVLCTSSPN